MSKKKNKKLRKILRSQAIESRQLEVDRSGQEMTDPSTEFTLSLSNGLGMTRGSSAERIKETVSEESHEVKKEISKILVTIGIMILAVVAIYFVNTKTDLILNVGEWIVSKLNLSI